MTNFEKLTKMERIGVMHLALVYCPKHISKNLFGKYLKT